jgi:hypothetical protein
MHRSPLPVLVIVAALAACSTRDASAETELLARNLLSQDSTLGARLASAPAPSRPALPEACGAVPPAARPAGATLSQAEDLARRGYDAEALGNLEDARTLLGRAAALDGTNESVAYHLGRTHEALGDRPGAVTAYCRFLALTPTTAESADARQRVARLSQPEPQQVATGGVGDTTRTPARAAAAAPRRSTRRLAARRPTAAPRAVASARVDRPAPAASRDRGTDPARATAGGASAAPSQPGPTNGSPADEGAAGRTAAGGDVVATPDRGATVEQPATASRTSGRGPSRAQRAGIGAAAGAIIGAVAGRSVKGALIGAAAGGVVGAATGGRMAPIGRTIRPYRP